MPPAIIPANHFGWAIEQGVGVVSRKANSIGPHGLSLIEDARVDLAWGGGNDLSRQKRKSTVKFHTWCLNREL
jgi:hypothetical protein